MIICTKGQELLADHARTIAQLGGVQILARRQKSLTSDIEAAVTGTGAAVYVFPLVPVAINANHPGPHVERMEARVRCIEDPDLNYALPGVYELAEIILRTFHHYNLVLPGNTTGLLLANANPYQPIEDPKRLIIDVTFQLQLSLQLTTPS